MKDENIYCDLCGESLRRHSEHTLHLRFKQVEAKKVWWWYRSISSVYEIDICSECYGLIRSLTGNKPNPFREVFSQYSDMSINDGRTYIKRLKALTTETHQHTKLVRSEQIKELEEAKQSISEKIKEIQDMKDKYGG